MKKTGMRDYSADYTYGYTTGYLGMWLSQRMGEYAPALRMTVGMSRADSTKSLKRCGEAIEREASTGVDQRGEERAGSED